MPYKQKGWSAFTQDDDKKYDVVIKYDDKGNMMHPKDWDPNYKSRFDISHIENKNSVDTTGLKEFEKWIQIKKEKLDGGYQEIITPTIPKQSITPPPSPPTLKPKKKK